VILLVHLSNVTMEMAHQPIKLSEHKMLLVLCKQHDISQVDYLV